MARLLVACQVIRYGFFIVRKSFSSFVLNFVIPPRLLWPFTYIYDSSVCDARCTHPASLMVLPSDPLFCIDLPILCESAGAALSTLAPGLQHMTVVYGSQPPRADVLKCTLGSASTCRDRCTLDVKIATCVHALYLYPCLTCICRSMEYATCASAGNGMLDLYMSLTAQLTSWLLGADGGSHGR